MTSRAPFPEFPFEHADFLRALARGLLRDEHRAEDLVQDAWIAAAHAPPRRAGATRGYLAAIVRNLAANARRGERRRQRREVESARHERLPSPQEAAEGLEVQRAVLDAVLAFEEPYRSTVYLRYYKGLGPSEIARREGVPLKTVKTRLSRALERLRARLDAESTGGRREWVSALAPLAFPPAPAAGASVAIGSLIGGALTMNKLAVIGIGVAAVVVAWRFAGGVAPEAPEKDAVTAAAEPWRAADLPAGEDAARRAGLEDVRTSTAREVADARRDEPAEPALCSLRVRVHWEGGGAAAGVGVEQHSVEDPAPRDVHQRARTDVRGEVSFDAIPPGEMRVSTDRGTRAEVSVAAGESGEIALELPREARVRGRVVDPAGVPVAGATIWGATTGAEGWPLAETAPGGSFEVTGLSADTLLGARAAGHLPSLLFAVAERPVAADGVREMVLEVGAAGGRVRGVVLDPAGEPVAGARVKVGHRGGHIVLLPDGRRGTKEKPVLVETDGRGRFVYPGDLPAGPQEAHVQARGFPTWSGTVDVADGRTAELEVRLVEPARIVGRLTTAEGEPVEGWRVVAAAETGGGWYHGAFPVPRAVTDAGGRFVLDWVEPGPQEIHSSKWDLPRLGRAQATVLCRSGEEVECELRLDVGDTITGRVVDSSGRPLVGWRVNGDPARQGLVYPRRDVTDATGAFLLANLGSSRFTLNVHAPAELGPSPRATVHAVEPGTAGVEIVVENTAVPSAHVRGRFLDATGGAPPDAKLLIQADGAPISLFVDFDSATGEFEYGPLLPGGFRLRAIRGGRTLAESEVFELAEGARHDVGVLSIATPGAVEVLVEGLTGAELADLSPTLDRFGHGTEHLVLDGDRHRSGDLHPGTWIARWTVGPRASRVHLPDLEIEVRPGETTRVACRAATPVREVTLTATFADPEAGWDHAWLEVRDGDGTLVRHRGPLGAARHLAGGELRFRLESMPAGTFEAEAWTDTGLRARSTLTVSPAALDLDPLVLQ